MNVRFTRPAGIELPECNKHNLLRITQEFQTLFCTTPGLTNVTSHFISTTGNPIKIPPRRIPAHYKEEVMKQLTSMLEQGIIEESSSPWMAPAVFVRKKNGNIRLCVDYRQQSRTLTPYRYQMRCRTDCQNAQYSQC